MKDKGPAPKIEDFEMRPDAWERFERTVKQVAKHKPAQRPAKAKPKPRRPAKKDRRG